MSTKLHNIIFALLLGVILGVTVYALHARMPEVRKTSLSFAVPAENRGEHKTETERMIKDDALSDHPAKYYRMIDE